MSTRDAIHVATAVRWHIPRIETYDNGLIEWDGQIGNPAAGIGKPEMPTQLRLELPVNDSEAEEAPPLDE